jgi:hypothetical protein
MRLSKGVKMTFTDISNRIIRCLPVITKHVIEILSSINKELENGTNTSTKTVVKQSGD